MKAFFTTDRDGAVHVRARMEGADAIGDFHRVLRAGQEFYGLSQEMLQDRGAGVIEVDGQGNVRLADP